MMKKLTRELALALAQCMVSATALAAEATLYEAQKDGSGYRNIRCWAAAGDTLYFLAKDRFYRWTEDMETAELIPANLRDSRFVDVDDGSVTPVSALFADEKGQLYGLYHVSGQVFAFDVTEEGVTCTDVAKITGVQELIFSNNSVYATPRAAAMIGDKLLWLGNDAELLVIDLKADAAKRCAVRGIRSMTPYKDGKVLLVRGTWPYTVYSYDPVTDRMAQLCQLPHTYSMEISYHAGLDLIVYQNKTRIMGIRPGEEPQQIGYIPQTGSSDHVVIGDSFVWISGEQAVARSITEGFAPERYVTLLDASITSAFTQHHPDVPYYFVSKNDLDGNYRDVLTSKEQTIDLVNFYCNTNQEHFYEMAEAGLLMDLSGSEKIAAYVADLYPPFRDAVTKDGAIYGVPVFAYGYDGWFVNKKVMQEMGLTAEDIPTSLTELCAFATRWNTEWAERYPQFTLIDLTEEYRMRMLEIMMDMWVVYCQKNGMPVDYDSPIFRELLAALESMQVDKLNANQRQTDTENREYKQALLWTGGRTVGNWAGYMEAESDRIFIPMTLTPETEYAAAVTEMNVWAVNAAAQNPEDAIEIVESVFDEMDVRYEHVLRMSCTEPVERSYFAVQVANTEAEIARLEAMKAESVNPEAMNALLAEQYAELATWYTTAQRYDIAPSAIQNYVEVIAPAMVVRRSDASTHSEFRVADEEMSAYLTGKVDADGFIKALNELSTK